jgi:hypothetical protein
MLGLLVASGVILIALRLQTGPWVTWYLWDLPRQHGIGRDLIGRFWLMDLLPRLTLPLLLAPLVVIGYVLRGERRGALFYALTIPSILGVAWASRSSGGGATNVLLPAMAALAIVLGLGFNVGLRLLDGSSTSARVFQTYLAGVCVLQLGLVIYNPRQVAPYISDRWADERLAERLAALPGPVFAPDMGGYLRGPGQAEQPLLSALDELLGRYGGQATAEGEFWEAELDRVLQQRRYRSIVLDKSDCCLKAAVKEHGYADAGPVIPAGDDFYFWRTSRTPDAELFVAPD